MRAIKAINRHKISDHGRFQVEAGLLRGGSGDTSMVDRCGWCLGACDDTCTYIIIYRILFGICRLFLVILNICACQRVCVINTLYDIFLREKYMYMDETCHG